MRQYIAIMSLLMCSMSCHADSLWLKATTNERGMFSDRKAYRVGDILKVNVNVGGNKGSINITRKEDRTAASIQSPLFQRLLSGLDLFKVSSTDLAATASNGGTVQLDVQNADVTATLSVVVIDVLPNNNLIIEGSRRLKILDQTVFTTVRGIVRVDDVAKDNTVNSSAIADLHVDMLIEGSSNDILAPGIIRKVHNNLNVM